MNATIPLLLRANTIGVDARVTLLDQPGDAEVGATMQRPGTAVTWAADGRLPDAGEILVVAQYIEVGGIPATMLHILP